MENFTGVWSLGNIIEFLKRNHLERGLGKFRNQYYNLEKKIPFEIYDNIIRLSGIDPLDMDEFENDYRNYLFEYEQYKYRKEKGIL